ncbi:hypothetical protein [Ruegeria sp.]|uniref:hypothetical protein n=1 Tax=Ruegeria sp. TaxID=1879320 RepID=UPI003B005B91
MEQLFLSVLNVVLPVLICVGIGYGLALTKSPFDNKVVGGIVSRVGYPTLILSHLAGTKLNVGTFLGMMSAARWLWPALAFWALWLCGFCACL